MKLRKSLAQWLTNTRNTSKYKLDSNRIAPILIWALQKSIIYRGRQCSRNTAAGLNYLAAHVPRGLRGALVARGAAFNVHAIN